MLKRSIPFFLLLFLLSTTSKGQSFFDRSALGVSGGSMLFYGDLTGYNVLPEFQNFSSSFGSGYRGFFKRKLAGGFGLRLGFEKGKLQGGHRNGRGAQHLSFRTDLMNFNLSANYELTRILAADKDIGDRKFYADLNVGVGLLLFRSYSYWSELGGIEQAYGYSLADGREENNELLLDKEERIMKLSIPVGVDLGYRVNHNTDITANICLFNTTTDKLDTFIRDWTARDKFGYFGLGVTYNFNRSEDQYPDNATAQAGNGSGNPEDIDVSDIDISEASGGKKGIFSDVFSGDASEEELLQTKLRLFQLQLQLFQMHYLLEEGK